MNTSELTTVGNGSATVEYSNLDRFTHLPETIVYRQPLGRQPHLPGSVRGQGLVLLLLSTALAEAAGNIVYVALLERAYQLSGSTASVGGVLLAQAAPQVLLGIWAGSLVDRVGKRKAAVLATIAIAALVTGLLVGQTILAVYVLAVLIMLARLLLIPARLALVSDVTNKTNLVEANTALSLATGLGFFLGPAIWTVLLLTYGYQAPLLVAGLGLLLSLVPLSLIQSSASRTHSVEQLSAWRETRSGWGFIRRHNVIWQVLLCQVYFALIMGAVTPLITPLAHEFGLGSGGIGLFFSAVGLGGLLGAPLAVVLARWLQTSVVLLLSGLLAPLGLLFIGVTDSHAGALAAILLTAMAGASLNVIVITVLQRLTPSKIQGCVFGVGQSLLGIAWVISLATISGVMAVWPEGASVQPLLIVVGGIGFLLFLAGWYRYRRQIQPACESCVPRLKNLGALCRAICESPSRVSAGACRLICGAQIQCGY